MHSVRSASVIGWSSAMPAKWLAPYGVPPVRVALSSASGVGQAHHQHAVVQERQHHRDQRGLLAAVQAGGGGEDARGLAGERAALPEERGAVEEVLERRRHVAEARRAAEGEAGAFLEVAQLGVGGAVDAIGFFRDIRGTVRTRAAAPGTRSIPEATSSAMRFTEPPTL